MLILDHIDTMANNVNSFFQKILNLFISSDTPENIKRRKLKGIAKSISKTRYNRWYKASGQELCPQMAQFFFSIYSVIGPARPLLASAVSSKVLKTITVESSLSAGQKKMLEHFSEDAIKERARENNGDAKLVAEKIQQELKLFIGEFDSAQIQKTDTLYDQIEAFIHFALFDYYFLLKKFDSGMVENNQHYQPNFQTIRGEYITEDLKDFATVLYQLDMDSNWSDVFKIIKTYKNIQPVHEGQWKKLVNTLNDVRRSGVLGYIIQHVTENIVYQPEITPAVEKVTDAYITNLKNATQDSIKQIVEEQKTSKVTILIGRIFGDKIDSGMKNYTLDSHAVFVKKGLVGFTHAEEMNYLKSFLIEYCKTDIRALCDLFLVRGNWGGFAGTTKEYSESFNAIMQIATKTVEFDEKLSEASDLGVKFRTLLSRMEREKEAGRQASKLLGEVNDTALKIINFSLKHLIVIANNFKNIIADYDKPRRDLIQNWKEIEQHSDRQIREWLVEAYKKVYDFVMLMQLFIKK